MSDLSRRTFIQLAGASLICGCGSSITIPGSTSYPLLAFSDLHFNPLFDPTLVASLDSAEPDQWASIFETSQLNTPSAFGSDTNYALLMLALASIGRNRGASPFILYTGDLLGHGISYYYPLYSKNNDVAAMRKFTDKAVSFVTQQIRSAAGDVPVFFAVGNCDSYTGYGPDSTFLGNTADTFYTQLLQGSADRPAFLDSFTRGGYYAAEPLGTNIMVIGLNTIEFSPLVQNQDGSENNAAAVNAELAWFDAKLASAKATDKKVWLLMHAPPGADEGTTAKSVGANGHLASATMMWEANYQATFLRTLAKYPGVLTMTLAGHTHMDEFRIMSAGNVVEIVPGISPVFGNDPAYKIFDIGRSTLAPIDYSAFNYDQNAATSNGFGNYYKFSEDYPSKGSLGSSLEPLCPSLATDSALQSVYRGHYCSGHNASNPITDINWAVYWAGIGNMWGPDLTNAVNSYS